MPFAPDATWPDGAAAADAWVIEPRKHGLIERAREIWQYRYLWWYFAGNALSALYRRTKLGWIWLLMRVAAPVGLNSLIFGGVLGVDSGGPPYFLFFVCGSTTWILFERSLIYVTRSVERNRKLVTKIYFPRLILPMASVAPGVVYLVVLILITAVTVVYYGLHDGVWYITLRPQLLASVVAILLSITFTVAVGFWTSVLQARYRDIRQGLRYVMQPWSLVTPIIYPVTFFPEQWRWLLHLNPMAGVVELYKWGTLGTGHVTVTSITMSVLMIALTAISGAWFFTRYEATSIDKL